MRTLKKYSPLAAGALIAMLLAATLLRQSPVRVEVGPIERGPLRVTVDEEGETRVRERYTIAAPVGGRLLRIMLDEGDEVESGGMVARIQPTALDPRSRAQAAARLGAAIATERAAAARQDQARAALEKARHDASRADRLRAAGAISAEEHEGARLAATTREAELSAARSTTETAKHEIESARAALLESTAAGGGPTDVDVRSPVAGRILRILAKSESVVPAGQPLIIVGDPRSLELVVDVLSNAAIRISRGARVVVEGWGGATPLAGRVRLVEPSAFTKVSALGVEEQRVNVVVDLDDSPAALGDGYRADVRIVVWESEDAVQVPTSALFRRGADWYVFVAEGGVARARKLDLGERGGQRAEVKGGGSPGQIVILHPSDLIEDGVAVELITGERSS